MKRFLDASVLVESCLAQSAKFAQADKLVSDRQSVTSAHALAEAYATLSGDPRLKIRPVDAAQMVDALAEQVTVLALDVEQYRDLITSAPERGVRGGSIYDALHAETARRGGCTEIHTLNVSHFKHVAPVLRIMGL